MPIAYVYRRIALLALASDQLNVKIDDVDDCSLII
jgi:hypothetical protein